VVVVLSSMSCWYSDMIISIQKSANSEGGGGVARQQKGAGAHDICATANTCDIHDIILLQLYLHFPNFHKVFVDGAAV